MSIRRTAADLFVALLLASACAVAGGAACPIQRVIKLNESAAVRCTHIAGLKETSVKATDASTVVGSMPKTSSPQGFLSILTFTVAGIVDSKEVKSHETAGDSGSG